MSNLNCSRCEILKSLLKETVVWATCGGYLEEVFDEKKHNAMILDKTFGEDYKIIIDSIRQALR